MESETSYLELQYKLVQQSRSVLLDYCRRITHTDLLNENSSFGRGGSIRNLLVHVVNTYQFWIVKNALKAEVVFTAYQSVSTIADIEQLFDEIDSSVYEFITTYGTRLYEGIDVEVGGTQKRLSVMELFTHVITHEFHHKGQVLSLSRHLGYIPVDTDIIR
jgi:uncharacterized damage-inducible protein DinB